MRKTLTILILMCFVFVAKSQSDDSGNALYPNNFTVTNPAVINNRIVLPADYPAPSTIDIKGSFGITISGMYKPYFSEIKTNIAVMSGDVVIASADGPSFNRADFTVGGVVYNNSTYKEFKLTINKGQTTGYHLFQGKTFVLRYKYYFDPAVGIPNQEKAGWAPQVTFGREWFIHSKQYPLDIASIPTSINGPSSTCDEANYSIPNPGTVTLENATNIAILAKLSESQWKVTRIVDANGEVNLKSTSNGKIVEKSIVIGTVTKGNIAGNAAIQLGESQIYTLALNDNTDYNWSVSYNPNITWTKQSATSIKLSTTGSVPMGWSENITISAQAVGSCGTASNYISKTIKFVNERDPRLD